MEFLYEACKALNLPDEPIMYYEKDSSFFRPAEVDRLRGDASLIQRDLGWRPTTSFSQMVKRMVDAEWKRVKSQ